jgi:hypothetical protein
MGQWAYKFVYIDTRGRISCEGEETLIGDERRSAFVRRYLNGLGRESWELVGIQPLTSNSSYYVFKRPAQESDYAEEEPAAANEQPSAEASTQQPPAQATDGPTIETA